AEGTVTGVIGMCWTRLRGPMPSSAGGLPVRTAMACSNCARCRRAFASWGSGVAIWGAAGGPAPALTAEAAFDLVFHDAVGFIGFGDRGPEQREQGIGGPETERGDGELGLRGELGVVEIGGAGLRARCIGLDLAPDAAPDIQIPGGADWYGVGRPVDRAPAAG